MQLKYSTATELNDYADKSITNLKVAEEEIHFSEVLESCLKNTISQNGSGVDLALFCTDCKGSLVPVFVHSAMIVSQSNFLKDLIRSASGVTDLGFSIIMLPEVNVETVRGMVHIIYSGRCYPSNDMAQVDVAKLMLCLGMGKVAQNLFAQPIEESVKRDLDESTSDNVITSETSSPVDTKDEASFTVDMKDAEIQTEEVIVETNSNTDIECNICTLKYNKDDLVNFRLHEQLCILNKNADADAEPDDPYPEIKSPLKIPEGDPKAEISLKIKHPKISKECPICGTLIAGSGSGWKYPLYSHLSRKHFSKELLRDYGTGSNDTSWKCRLCGKDESAFSGACKKTRFLAHLGAKHKLVEKYMDLSLETGKPEQMKTALELKSKKATGGKGKNVRKSNEDAVIAYTPPRKMIRVADVPKKGSVVKIKDELQPEQVSTSKRKRSLPKRFKDDELSTSSDDSGFLPPKEQERNKINADRKIKNVSCDYCDRKVVIEPVLQSHLLSRHFRADCERAITQIFDLTDGRCPLCPGRSWSWPGQSLNWSMFLHFSRKHRIAEGLTFSGNKLNQKNVDLILKKFFPDVNN